jgi:Transposase DDE domain group 1
MVHDLSDVVSGPSSVDQVRVVFDEERLISDAGLLLTASLAGRLGIEQLVNETVWLGHGVPGAALPGRKVMTLVHGMLAGADSIDDMNIMRAGSTELIVGHGVMAPSTLGTFLRAFTFGHVRQLDHVLDQALGRAWSAGAGPGEERLVIDIDSFVGEVHGDQKQGAGYGYTKQLGYHPLLATRAGTGEVLHIRNRKGKANTQRGNPRFVDEVIARVRRAGATGTILIRADRGFENHKLFKSFDARKVEFSSGVKQRKPIRALIDLIGEDGWVTVEDYPPCGEAQIAETKLGDLAADRPPHPTRRRASRAVPRLALSRVRDQPNRTAATGRGQAPRPRCRQSS